MRPVSELPREGCDGEAVEVIFRAYLYTGSEVEADVDVSVFP
jgi:hypothetical protein